MAKPGPRKIAVHSNKVAKPFGPYSQAIQCGGLIFVAGITPVDEDGKTVWVGNVQKQTEQVFENIKEILRASGATLDDIVDVTVFVKHAKDIPTISKIRYRYFKQPYPTSTAVAVTELASPDYLIEVKAVALDPNRKAVDFA